MTDGKRKPVLYTASVSPLRDERLYRLAYDRASSARRQKADSFRFEKDKYLCLGAEMLLRAALHEAGLEYDPARIRTGSCGKPYFEDSDLFFSLSHSGERVLCAIAGAEIGCDIEKIRPVSLQIAERFFCPEEYRRIAAQDSEAERDLLFHRIWTLKESFLKAVGSGMTLPLSSFCIELGDDIRVRQSVDRRDYSFAEFGELSGYCCAVCCAGIRPDSSLRSIDLSGLP